MRGFWRARFAPRIGLVDVPDQRKAHQQTTPLGGGIAIWLGVVAPLAIGQFTLSFLVDVRAFSLLLPDTWQVHMGGLWQLSGELWILVAAGSVLLVLGLWDDWRGLDWRIRLAVQTAVAVVVVSRGWQLTFFLPWPWVTKCVTVLWIVGLTNSF